MDNSNLSSYLKENALMTLYIIVNIYTNYTLKAEWSKMSLDNNAKKEITKVNLRKRQSHTISRYRRVER